MMATNSPIAGSAAGPQDKRVEMAIRPMARQDAAIVAAIQVATLPHDVWSRLGVASLRLFYEGAVEFDEIGFVATSRAAVIGFAMGGLHPETFFRSLLPRKVPRFAIAVALASLRQPRLLLRILGGLLKRSHSQSLADTAVLMYMAVEPGWQGLGIGRALAEAFAREAARRGAVRIRLKTDKFDNDATNAFYQRLGFSLTGESLTLDQRLQNEYEAPAGEPDLSDLTDEGAGKTIYRSSGKMPVEQLADRAADDGR